MLHTAVSAAVDLSLGPGHVPAWLHVLNTAALALIAAVIAMVVLHADLEAVVAPSVAPSQAPPGPTGVDGGPVEPALLARLERLMTIDQVYRQEGVTIGALAGRLGLSERRLHHAINRGPSQAV